MSGFSGTRESNPRSLHFVFPMPPTVLSDIIELYRTRIWLNFNHFLYLPQEDNRLLIASMWSSAC
jgi:hypothetical protein